MDETEGIGIIKKPGEKLLVNTATRSIQVVPGIEELYVDTEPKNHFICCLTTCKAEEIEEFSKKFGCYCVVVHDPERLIKDISEAIAKDIGLSVNPPTLEHGMVRYDKGHQIGRELNRDEKIELPWRQKPSEYNAQKEYRLHFNFTSHELIDSPKEYVINIGDLLKYCELIEVSL